MYNMDELAECSAGEQERMSAVMYLYNLSSLQSSMQAGRAVYAARLYCSVFAFLSAGCSFLELAESHKKLRTDQRPLACTSL
jgi:hypothetical protein